MKQTKYHSIKTTIDGITFDSKKEAKRYIELKVAEANGIIRKLELQPRFTLLDSFRHDGKTHRAIVYVADFRYEVADDDGKWIVEDVKGMETRVFRIKKKLFHKRYPYIELRLI